MAAVTWWLELVRGLDDQDGSRSHKIIKKRKGGLWALLLRALDDSGSPQPSAAPRGKREVNFVLLPFSLRAISSGSAVGAGRGFLEMYWWRVSAVTRVGRRRGKHTQVLVILPRALSGDPGFLRAPPHPRLRSSSRPSPWRWREAVDAPRIQSGSSVFAGSGCVLMRVFVLFG